MRSTFPRSGVLSLGLSSIHAVLPSTLISQVESLLDSHRIEGAVNLADAQRVKLQGNISVDSDETDELCYVYQRIGFRYLNETLFQAAGENLFNGDLDPRLLIRYFPDLRGSLFMADDVAEVFAGVAEYMPVEDSVDDMIVTNLVRNYSPHLAPDTRSAPPTVELRNILGVAAREMLEVFLRKWRSANIGGHDHALNTPGRLKKTSTVHPSIPVVDTVLAKLYSEFGRTSDLLAFLQEPNHILLSEVEPVLTRRRQYPALCLLYKERGEVVKLLEVWSKFIDGEWTHEDIKDPLSDMIMLLTEKTDTALIRKWGVWLMKRDPEHGLKLLTKDSGKRRERSEDDLELLEQIREANSVAGIQFLEYLVLQKRSASREIHTQLAVSYVDRLSAALKEDSVSKLWRAKVSYYESNSTRQTSFLSYFVSTTPDSTHKHLRLKAILYLGGSTMYDAGVIYPQILTQRKTLMLELAIVEGKLGNHYSALNILAHELHDYTTAEAYCMLGGAVVSSNAGWSIAKSDEGLEKWATVLFDTPKSSLKVARQYGHMPVDNEIRRRLLEILLEVYMKNVAANTSQVSHLLNSRATSFDVVDVVDLVPPHWPVNLLSTFLTTSFERILHEQCKGKIMKAVNAGQNLVMKEHSWLLLQQHGMVIEEDVDDQSFGGFENSVLAEKLALQSDDLAILSDGKEVM